MLIEEKMLAAFRGEDGLCRLKPKRGGPHQYADYPKLLAELHEAAKQANLMRDGALKTIFTWNYFEELSDCLYRCCLSQEIGWRSNIRLLDTHAANQRSSAQSLNQDMQSNRCSLKLPEPTSALAEADSKTLKPIQS